ncbi:hypothetical protein, partial [Thioclava dalianensis]|uniref:hypothetical protein n=1 Tax=Thioclava dalianensis TaxID=1185766 RepID=UPI001B7FF931
SSSLNGLIAAMMSFTCHPFLVPPTLSRRATSFGGQKAPLTRFTQAIKYPRQLRECPLLPKNYTFCAK